MRSPPDLSASPRLVLRGITKRYPAVVANDNVNLEVRPGEIHALLGENGAGKSTLMKIVYGVTKPDAGSVIWEGRPVHIGSPAEARRLGIGMVFQHFSLFETLTVAENISLALDERTAPEQLASRIREVSENYGLPIDPKRLVHSMSVGERQRVEIVRCLLQSPKLLIMDEPTSVLTPQAVLKLFETLRRLAHEGCSILYISHKLDEIRALCDTATVLRGGRVTGTAIPSQETPESLARMMIGSELPECHLQPRTPGDIRLELDRLGLPTLDPFGVTLREIGLSVRSGEIVGIAGVSGNGQKELLTALSGESTRGQDRHDPHHGTRRPDAWIPRSGAGWGLRSCPRKGWGVARCRHLSLADNALLTGSSRGMVQHGVIRHATVREFARAVIERFKVKCKSEQAAASSLSGGNLQKFIVGRETMLEPKVIVVAQPTWGVDIGASMLIRQALIDLRDRGVAVLVISEELDELFMISDRIAVMAQGRLSPAVPSGETSLEQIGAWMGGVFETAEPLHA